jgi:aminoglycoside phosphotransferase (APT) family kinase protein
VAYVIWDDRMLFNATRPSKDGLQRMATALGWPTARVATVRRLKGGVDASTHAVRLEPGGWVVLKRSWTMRPKVLEGEFVRLGFAEPANVPTPEPLAFDGDGDWFGRPALVMSQVPGQSLVSTGPGPWIAELATALAAIHAMPLPPDPPAIVEDAPHAGVAWQPMPDGNLARTARARRLMAIAGELQDDLRRYSPPSVLLHHDFHHGNVTWRSNGRLGGVVDWNEACLGPAACDVGYCSVDLSMTHGPAVAEAFVRAYESVVGDRVDDLRRWQALWVANGMRWVGYWVIGFRETGMSDLTLPLLRRRLRAFGDFVLSRI